LGQNISAYAFIESSEKTEKKAFQKHMMTNDEGKCFISLKRSSGFIHDQKTVLRETLSNIFNQSEL
jgi:hypothetical protein